MGHNNTENNKKSSKSVVYTVDVNKTGISFGRFKSSAGSDVRDNHYLRISEQNSITTSKSRELKSAKNHIHQLESHMMVLSERGVLRDSCVVLGVQSDPFFPFNGKFEKSIQLLELFKRYTPGRLHIQTRSPLIVIALPVLSKLGNSCSVSIGIETNSEGSSRRYTPDLPRVSERIKAVRALSRFGIETHIQVSPVLPYGDWKRDAGSFAEMLVENAKFLDIRSLVDGSRTTEQRVKNTGLAKKLAEDRKFHYLRPDASNPLRSEIENLAPEKLIVPKYDLVGDKQLNLFAA